MKKLIVTLALITLTGCAGGQLCHSNKGVSEFNHDKYMCTKGLGGSSEAQFFNILNFNECMQQRFGWYRCN